MSLIGKIVTLFSDKEKTAPVFPRTKVSAVSDDDGVGLNVLLDNVNEAIDNVRITADAAQDVVTPAEEDEGKILKVVDGAASWANHKIGRKDLENDALYSPIKNIGFSKELTVDDIGCTIHNSWGYAITLTLNDENSAQFPNGAEIAIMRWSGGADVTIAATGNVRLCHAEHSGYIMNASLKIPETFGMVALKKILGDATGTYWLLTGNVEVV